MRTQFLLLVLALIILQANARAAPENRTYPINIRRLSGELITVEVKKTDTINEVKQRVAEQVGNLPVDQQNYLYQGQRLAGPSTLASYRIRKGATILIGSGCSIGSDSDCGGGSCSTGSRGKDDGSGPLRILKE